VCRPLFLEQAVDHPGKNRFLELGGDSILAGRITARVCALFSIELPMMSAL
jgi:hypothetical protein